MPQPTPEQVWAEISAGPHRDAWAELVTHGAANKLSVEMNLPREGEAVYRGEVSRSEMTKALFGNLDQLHLKAIDDPVRLKWEWRLRFTLPLIDSFNTASARTQAVLAEMQSDGLLTADEVASLSARPGSRAEVLGGPGYVVSLDLVSRALEVGRGK